MPLPHGHWCGVGELRDCLSAKSIVASGPSTVTTNHDVRSTYRFEVSGGIRGYGFPATSSRKLVKAARAMLI